MIAVLARKMQHVLRRCSCGWSRAAMDERGRHAAMRGLACSTRAAPNEASFCSRPLCPAPCAARDAPVSDGRPASIPLHLSLLSTSPRLPLRHIGVALPPITRALPSLHTSLPWGHAVTTIGASCTLSRSLPWVSLSPDTSLPVGTSSPACMSLPSLPGITVSWYAKICLNLRRIVLLRCC